MCGEQKCLTLRKFSAFCHVVPCPKEISGVLSGWYKHYGFLCFFCLIIVRRIRDKRGQKIIKWPTALSVCPHEHFNLRTEMLIGIILNDIYTKERLPSKGWLELPLSIEFCVFLNPQQIARVLSSKAIFKNLFKNDFEYQPLKRVWLNICRIIPNEISTRRPSVSVLEVFQAVCLWLWNCESRNL